MCPNSQNIHYQFLEFNFWKPNAPHLLSLPDYTKFVGKPSRFNKLPNSPPSFKAFVYLTDVSDPKYGPYSVVPGSHLNVMRKWRARCLDEIIDLQYAQMELEYKTGEATPLVGEKGDCLISAMTLVHAGWPLHSERTRYVVVFYLNVEPGWTGPFVHGRDHITSQSE